MGWSIRENARGVSAVYKRQVPQMLLRLMGTTKAKPKTTTKTTAAVEAAR
mgnify:CR=1 FL=1